MPTYDFSCPKCGNVFEEYMGFDDDRSSLKCPNCKSKKVQRVFTSVQMGISKGNGGASADECHACRTPSACSTCGHG